LAERVTLEQVAQHAGVSRATASLVLRGTGRVSAETRERVTESMRTLGYVYNRGAASLREQRSQLVGLLVTSLANPLFAELTMSIEQDLAQAGYATVLTSTYDDRQRQRNLLTTLLEHRVAGLVVVPVRGSTAADLEPLRRMGVPTVLATRHVEAQLSYVGADNAAWGALAARHLLEHGCRRIAYVGGPRDAIVRRERVEGYVEAIGSAAETLVIAGETSVAGGVAAGRELLARDPRPEGIVCHSDAIAFGVYRALGEHGLQPADVRVVGLDGLADGEWWEPPLTTVTVPGGVSAAGAKITAMLLAAIEQPERAPEEFRYMPELIIRRSCGCHRP
jgi:LacI family transcriptional regulator